jgi:hypothetical protein
MRWLRSFASLDLPKEFASGRRAMRKGFFIETLMGKGVSVVGSFFLPNSCHF